MHLPTPKLLRHVTISPHPTIIPESHPHPSPTSSTPSTLTPTQGPRKLNIKDKRNIKVGIVTLRQISKWADKAALEKLEGQQGLEALSG
jgi:hypothetical protein